VVYDPFIHDRLFLFFPIQTLGPALSFTHVKILASPDGDVPLPVLGLQLETVISGVGFIYLSGI
jgi:hypothetical protein